MKIIGIILTSLLFLNNYNVAFCAQNKKKVYSSKVTRSTRKQVLTFYLLVTIIIGVVGLLELILGDQHIASQRHYFNTMPLYSQYSFIPMPYSSNNLQNMQFQQRMFQNNMNFMARMNQNNMANTINLMNTMKL